MTERNQKPPYPLRIPDELRTALEAFAAQHGRSLNAEITDRLEKSFESRSADQTLELLIRLERLLLDRELEIEALRLAASSITLGLELAVEYVPENKLKDNLLLQYALFQGKHVLEEVRELDVIKSSTSKKLFTDDKTFLQFLDALTERLSREIPERGGLVREYVKNPGMNERAAKLTPEQRAKIAKLTPEQGEAPKKTTASRRKKVD
jgi:plasmid stability protein